MRIENFIGQLAESQIFLQDADGELKIRGPKTRLDQETVSRIRQRKTEVLEFFASQAKATPPTSNDTPFAKPFRVNEYTAPSGKIASLTDQEFNDLLDIFKILYYWQYGQFIP